MDEECTCTNSCPEDSGDNPCPHCRELDLYEPCPVIGFGCGTGATCTTEPCDCCTNAQWAAAMST